MISADATGKKKFSMNPQVGRAMSGPPIAKPAAALPGTVGDVDDSSSTATPAAEPLNVNCPSCGAQIPVTAENIAQPEQAATDTGADAGDLGGASMDEGDMA